MFLWWILVTFVVLLVPPLKTLRWEFPFSLPPPREIISANEFPLHSDTNRPLVDTFSRRRRDFLLRQFECELN